MPISPIVLQRRLREAGRIRIGEKVEGERQDGSTFTRPSKLDVFRFTSRDEQAIRAVAEQLGGTAEQWEHPRDGAQWQVKSEAKVIDVVVPPPEVALSQWLELWSGGGCQRRCDGVREVIGDRPCVCDTEDRERACRPHTRLSVALPDIESFGLWRLDTLGWNAAAELPGSVEIAQMFAERGVRFLPARLLLEVREDRKPGQKPKKYAVPVLDLGVSLRQVAAIAAAPPTGELPPAAHFAPVPIAELPEGPGASVADAVTTVGHTSPPKRGNAAAPIPATGLTPRRADDAPVVPGAPPPDELLDDDDAAAGTTTPAAGPDPTAGGALDTSATATPPATGSSDPKRTQIVAICCKDAGLDDDGRHAFLEAFSRQQYPQAAEFYASAKDVPAEHLDALRRALKRLEAGQLTLSEKDGVPVLIEVAFGWPSTDPGAMSRQGAQAVGETIDVPSTIAAEGEGGSVSPATPTPSAVDWKAELEATPGIGETKLLNEARKRANAAGLTQPADVAGIDSALVDGLRDWLIEKRRDSAA